MSVNDLRNDDSQRNENLTIFAAASLTEAFTEIGESFEVANPGIEVSISLAGSQQLAQQLSQGAPADVFASADNQQMENVIMAGRVNPGTDQPFANNKLVLIMPGDNPGDIFDLGDLAKPGLKIVLADKAVPAGRYSLDMLARASEQDGFGEQFKLKVLNNVVSYEENVRAVLTKIILGEADAGIVYASDISGAQEEDITMIEIPEQVNITASYYIAPLSESTSVHRGMSFIRFVLSPTGQDILEQNGFSRAGENE
jgi:molybdate transport system substrate-binding protein